MWDEDEGQVSGGRKEEKGGGGLSIGFSGDGKR